MSFERWGELICPVCSVETGMIDLGRPLALRDVTHSLGGGRYRLECGHERAGFLAFSSLEHIDVVVDSKEETACKES